MTEAEELELSNTCEAFEAELARVLKERDDLIARWRALCEALGENPDAVDVVRLGVTFLDASRWRALWACERIRVVGGADIGTPDALLGLDFHRKHPARDDADSRKMLLAFVDSIGEPVNMASLLAERDELAAEVAAYQLKDAGLLPGWAWDMFGSAWRELTDGEHLSTTGYQWSLTLADGHPPHGRGKPTSGTAESPRAAMRAAEAAGRAIGWPL